MARLKDLGKVRDSFLMSLEKLIPGSTIGENVREDFSCVPERARNMALLGQLECIEIRMNGDGKHAIITDGECRYRAAMYANEHYITDPDKKIKSLWCIAEPKGTTPGERILRQINHNGQRADLQPFELARAYKKLMDEHKYSAATIAECVGCSPSVIYSAVRLLNAPEEARKMVNDGRMSKTAASTIASAPEEKKQEVIEKSKDKKRVRVADVQKEVSGRAAMISATHIERCIKIAVANVKKTVGAEELTLTESDKWDAVAISLGQVLRGELIEEV